MAKKEEKDIEKYKETKQVGRWLGRIKVAQKKHEDEFEKKAKRWRDFYEGNHFPDIADKSNLIVVNYTYSILKAIIPQIYFQDPYVYLRANERAAWDNRQLAEDSLNEVWRTIKVKRQMKRIILDMLVLGFGIGKSGYWFETEKKESLETQAGFTEAVKEEYPYFLRQSPFDVVFDFEAKNFDEIRWIAARYYVPLEELKEKYPDKTKDMKGNFVAGDNDGLVTKYTGSGIEKDYIDDDLKRVEIWEVHDIVNKKIHIVTEENKDEFLESFDNPYKLQSNFRILFVNEIPDKLYPVSDVASLQDINLWMDKVNSLLIQHMLKSQRKIMATDSAFASDEEKQKFLSGDDMQLVIAGTEDINKSIMIIPASIISPDFYNNNELCKDHLDNVSGVGANQRGVADNVERRTATEAGIVDQKSQLRNSERLDTITDFCISVAGDLLSIMQQYVSKDTEFFNDKRGFMTWNNDKIQGRFTPNIKIGSTIQPNSEAERQFLMQFVGQMIQVVDDNGVPVIDKPKFIKLILEKFNITMENIEDAMLSVQEYVNKVQEGLAVQQDIKMMSEQMVQPQMQQIMTQPQQQIAVNPQDIMAAMGQGQPMGEPQLSPEEQALLQGV